jgi:hypothetical protein
MMSTTPASLREQIFILIDKLNSQEQSSQHGFCLIDGPLTAPSLWYADPLGGTVVPFPGSGETYESILACLTRIDIGDDPKRFRHALLVAELQTFNEVYGTDYIVLHLDGHLTILDSSGDEARHIDIPAAEHSAARLWWRLLAGAQAQTRPVKAVPLAPPAVLRQVA